VVSPSFMRSPLSSGRGCLGSRRIISLITVPFTEPRSSTMYASPSRQMRACRRETFVCGSKRDRSTSGKIFESGSVRPTRLLSFCKLNEASSSVVPATISLAVGRATSRGLESLPPSGWRDPQCAQKVSSAAIRPPQNPQNTIATRRVSPPNSCAGRP